MKVLMFKPQFTDAVGQHIKRQTVRPVRKNPIKPGDKLSLRHWLDLPYRSKQVLLRTATCTTTHEITISRDGFVIINGLRLCEKEQEEFANDDGFIDSKVMVAWFDQVHGLPFRGTLIKWD
jgi:hypothetical protein